MFDFMPLWLRYVLVAIAGYLMGNISLGIIVSKLYGIRDIRKHGSGNSGTTNVLRTLGWVPSVLTLVGDLLKAYLAAQLGRAVCGDIGLLVGGVAAVLGHDYPVFLHFKGGKGIASSGGLIFAVNPILGACEIALVILIVGVTRYMSIASLVGATVFPIAVAIIRYGQPYYWWYLGAAIFTCLMAFYCHRANISRLIHHTENRLDFEKISKISSKFKGKNK